MAEHTDFCVVIPTLNEAARIETTTAAVRRAFQGMSGDIYVADGGSDDGTAVLSRCLGCRVLSVRRGRGIQLRAGSAAAMENLEDEDVLVFVHADTILPPEAGRALAVHYADPAHHIALFRARFDRKSPVLRTYAWFTRFDSYWTSFGDQVISIRKRFYREIGGFPPWSSFEDVDLLRKARRRTRIGRIPVCVTTSARMYNAVGQIRQQIRNAWLLLRFWLGASPASFYTDYYRPLHRSDNG